MANNVVTLGFAGDASDLTRTFADVGQAATKTAGDFVSAEGKAKSFGSAMDGVGGAVGGAESKFMGTADLLDGLGGAFGLPTEGATGLMRAFGDLSGGFEVVQGFLTGGAKKILDYVKASKIAEVATKIWTGVQAAFNAVMALNPAILIGAAVVALGVALVVAYKKSEAFRDIVHGAFDKVKGVVTGVMDFFKKIPEIIGGVGGAILDVILWPYKTAFNMIAKAWNNTVGKLQFEVPDWVPGLGGKGFKMPQLPTFHAGGVVPGIKGAEVPILARAGEHFTPSDRGPERPAQVHVYIDGREIHQSLLRLQRTSGALGLS